MEKKDSLRIARIFLTVINITATVLVLLYVIIRPQGGYVNTLTICILCLIILDFAYLAFAKGFVSTLLILVLTFVFWLIYFTNLLVHFTFFPASYSVVSTLFFIATPITTIVYICLEFFKPIDNKSFKKEKTITDVVIFLIAFISLFFCIMSYDLVNFVKDGFHYYAELDFFHFFICITLLFLVLKLFIGGKKLAKNITLFTLIVVMLCFNIFNFSRPIFSINADIKSARESYVSAFSEKALMNDTASRSMPVNLIDAFVGIPTKNVASDKDILYYEAKDGKDKGLKLYYDVYYNKNKPVNASVLIRMHGWNCDKSNANNPQYDKYFASLGFVVYDIQYGVFSEKQEENIDKPYHREMEEYMFFIREFVKYAKENSADYNANFDSVFISGHSFGGSMTLGFGLSFNKNDPLYDDLDITVKGLIPFYPGWSGVSDDGWDFHNQVDENSLPCLMMMGLNDNGVDPSSARVIGEFYKKHNNNNYAVVGITYARHAYDNNFVNLGNQLTIYYMERFMLYFK